MRYPHVVVLLAVVIFCTHCVPTAEQQESTNQDDTSESATDLGDDSDVGDDMPNSDSASDGDDAINDDDAVNGNAMSDGDDTINDDDATNGNATSDGDDTANTDTDDTITTPTASYQVNFSISGLQGAGLTLQNNGGDAIAVTTDGTFTFSSTLENGASYSVSIAATPDGQICSVVNGTGLVNGADVTDVAVNCAVAVVSLYGANGANWNDYVRNDGADRLSADDVACQSTDTGGYYVCIHGGEFRRVVVFGESDCANLTATDDLSAFNWICDESHDPVQMVSTGLKDGKYLSGLIDFDAGDWRDNFVTVKESGATIMATSPEKWWANPVGVYGEIGVAQAGAVLIVTSSATNENDYSLGDERMSLVVKPSVVTRGEGGVQLVSLSSSADFCWIEGAFDATGYSRGINTNYADFCVLRGVEVASADTPGVFDDARDIHVLGSKNHLLWDVLTSDSKDYGVHLENSSYNTLYKVISSNNTEYGVYLSNAYNNVLSHVTAFNTNNNHGLIIKNSAGNLLYNVTTANNNSQGIVLWDASYNVLVNSVAVANSLYGVWVYEETGTTIGNVFLNTAGAHNFFSDYYLDGSSGSYFTGLLKVDSAGGDCIVNGGANPGLVNATCTDDNSYGSSTYTGQLSDAVLSSQISLAGAFVDKVESDDTANASDVNGTQTNSGITDWFQFDNEFRGWGKEHADAFPGLNNARKCSGAGACRIWDWSLVSGDAGDYGADGALGGGDDEEALLGQVPCPTGNSNISRTAPIDHFWNVADADECADIAGAVWISADASCVSTFLRNAVEVLGDGIGNENLLCESEETCLYTPNIGSYQGSGALVSAVAVVANTDSCADIGADDTIFDVILKKYGVNGVD